MMIITVKVAAITSHSLCRGKWVDRLSFHPQLVHRATQPFEWKIKSEHPMKIIYNIYRFYVDKMRTSFTQRSVPLPKTLWWCCAVSPMNVCDFHLLITQFLFIGRYFILEFFSVSSSVRRMRFTWNTVIWRAYRLVSMLWLARWYSRGDAIVISIFHFKFISSFCDVMFVCFCFCFRFFLAVAGLSSGILKQYFLLLLC